MKATIKDVARLAQVSPSTVSRALRDNPRISEDVRQRVKQIAKELDFHPNQMARSLVNRQTRIVGVIFAGSAAASMGHPFYPQVLQGLGKAASQNRYHILLSTGADVLGSEEAMHEVAESGFVSGLVSLATETSKHGELRSGGLPIVEIGHPLDPDHSCSVDNDNVAAGYEVTQYLLQRGHKRILFLGSDSRFFVMSNRLKGFRKAMADTKTPVREDWIIPSGMIESALDLDRLGEIFQASDRPTAVVSMDDPLSIGLIGFLSTLGLSTPEDVSVISFNASAAGSYHAPALTSVDIHPEELGERAMGLLLDMLRGRVEPPVHIVVPFHIVERDSVATIKD